MLKDRYLEKCKKLYAIKAGEILVKIWNNDYLELSYDLLEQNNKVKMTNAFVTILEKELKILNKKSIRPTDENQEDQDKETINVDTIIKKITKRHRVGGKRDKSGVDQDWIENKINKIHENRFNQRGWVSTFEDIFENIPHLFETYKEIQKKLFEKTIHKEIKQTEFQNKLKEFSQIFNLSNKEIEIITFLFLTKTDSVIEDFFGGRDMNLSNLSKSTRYFCRFFEIKPWELREFFSKNSVLIKAGIIQKSSFIRRRSENVLELSDTVVSFLCGISAENLESEYVKKVSLNDALKLNDHNVSDEKKSIFKHLLSTDKGCNIILYGHPGTGKTEFAKSLGLETGKDIYFINQSDENDEEDLDFRKQAIIAAHNIISPKNSIIVVDECDTILNIFDGFWKCETKDGQDRKAWINEFLDNATHKIIWISNKVNGIDESTKRRFSFSMEFTPLSYFQRKRVWETQINKQSINFMKQEDIELMARELKVNSGGITLALRDVNEMKELKSDKEKMEVLTTLLRQHKSFTEDEVIGLIKKSNKYSLDVVNSNYPLEKILQTTDEFLRNAEQFNRIGIYNMNILLQGPPGTGKTEFVKHLAEVTDKELIIKRASDIRSKWYGESVKNIAQSFKEAQENGSILFFDEADSFFGSRETASTHHGEETNEFLTQMENFQGVLICATNFTDRLDQASLRRFNHKIKFDYLNERGKKHLFLTYFSELFESLPQEDTWRKLEKIQGLTPGDFKVVYQKNAFTKCDPLNLVKEIENEVSYKKAFSKKVGLS
jgi:transitional endoplasmic reticulum ATPase